MLEGLDEANVNSDAAYTAQLPRAQFVIGKASDGLTFDDVTFSRRIAIARAAGKLVGAYHFAEPNDDWAKQAAWFVQCAKPQPGDLLALDVEVTKGRTYAQIAAGIVTFDKTVLELAGAHVLLYSYTSYLKWLLSSAGVPNRAYLYGMWLWVADPNHAEGHPELAGFGSWLLHQYGEHGGLDADELNGDAAAWLAAAVPSQSPTPVLEDDMARIYVDPLHPTWFLCDGFTKRPIAPGEQFDLANDGIVPAGDATSPVHKTTAQMARIPLHPSWVLTAIEEHDAATVAASTPSA